MAASSVVGTDSALLYLLDHSPGSTMGFRGMWISAACGSRFDRCDTSATSRSSSVPPGTRRTETCPVCGADALAWHVREDASRAPASPAACLGAGGAGSAPRTSRDALAELGRAERL